MASVNLSKTATSCRNFLRLAVSHAKRRRPTKNSTGAASVSSQMNSVPSEAKLTHHDASFHQEATGCAVEHSREVSMNTDERYAISNEIPLQISTATAPVLLASQPSPSALSGSPSCVRAGELQKLPLFLTSDVSHQLSNSVAKDTKLAPADAKRTSLCNEADWVVFDPDDVDKMPLRTSKPIRADGCSHNLQPRIVVPRNLDLSATELSLQEKFAISLDEELHDQRQMLPRCRSVEVSLNDANFPWLQNSPTTPPSSPLPSLSCSCSSVSTSAEWKTILHVE